MSEEQTPPTNTNPIIAGDPKMALQKILGKKFLAWVTEKKGKDLPELLIVWRPPVDIFDPVTGDQSIEMRCDVIAKGELPHLKARILTSFYAHLKQVPSSSIIKLPGGIISQ